MRFKFEPEHPREFKRTARNSSSSIFVLQCIASFESL